MAVIDTGPLEVAIFGELVGMHPYVLFEALRMLTLRESQVLRLRYGLDDGIFRTHSEVGSRLGVSKQRVSELEEIAMRKLRARGSMVSYRRLLKKAKGLAEVG